MTLLLAVATLTRAGVAVPPVEVCQPGHTATPRQRLDQSALDAEVQALRSSLRLWKERDFCRLFGDPTDDEDADVRRVPEPWSARVTFGGPDWRPRHTSRFVVSDLGRLAVCFLDDGQDVTQIAVHLRVAGGFVPIADASADPSRVAWARAVVRRMARHIADRWRVVVGWEVDPDAARFAAVGTESANLPAKLGALRREAGWHQLHENMPTAQFWCYQSEPNSRGRLKAYYVHGHAPQPGEWYWTDGNSRLVSLRTRPPAADGVPQFDLEVDTADGVRRWDESGIEGHVRSRRFYRADGSMVRYEGFEVEDGRYRGAVWSWYGRTGQGNRTEADTNGDGIPNEVSDRALHEKGPARPLAVEQSWAVNPELVPADSRIPGQPARRLPVRRIP